LIAPEIDASKRLADGRRSGGKKDQGVGLHIAFYVPAWLPSGAANGIVTYVTAIREHLVSVGHKVSIVTVEGFYPHGSSEICRSREVRGWSALRRRALSFSDGLFSDTAALADQVCSNFRELHRRHPIDVIEMEESFGWFSQVSRMGVPVVARLHGPYFLSFRWSETGGSDAHARARERRERAALARAKAISSPSSATLRATCARYQCARAIREVIPNPVAPVPESALWSVEGADPDRILWVGRFDRAKGADLMLDAFAHILSRHPNARLDMVGPDLGIGSEDGGILKFEAYAGRFLDPWVRERITFRDFVPPAAIPELRAKAALTVVTSRTENFPYAVAEAFQIGSPVLATRWSGIEEIVKHGETGWVVDHESAEAIADGVDKLLRRPELRQIIGVQGWEFSRTHLAPPVVAEKTICFYQQVIGDGC
jgi:glycosyltransferase involved in cell wall biosynthesis